MRLVESKDDSGDPVFFDAAHVRFVQKLDERETEIWLDLNGCTEIRVIEPIKDVVAHIREALKIGGV